MNKTFLRGIFAAMGACLTLAHADHMSPWYAGWASMPNDIHNTRIDTRLVDDDAAFRDFVMYGEGADSTNRFLLEETAAVESVLGGGHQVERLAARLDPLPDFNGGGWARYSLFDGDTAVAGVLNISVRLRLVRQNGTAANEALELTADNAEDKAVGAVFRDYTGIDYAGCDLVYDGLIDSNLDGIADYASYSLSLKEDPSGLVEGSGRCVLSADPLVEPAVPAPQPADILDVTVDDVRPVLMGSF